MPRGQDLVAYAKNNWMPVFDNLSILPAAFQDDLCHLATGGAWVAGNSSPTMETPPSTHLAQ
jgi:hypothetical protein